MTDDATSDGMSQAVITQNFTNTTLALVQVKDTFRIIAGQTQEHSRCITNLLKCAETLSSNMSALSANVETLAKDGNRIAGDVTHLRDETRTSLDAMRDEIRELRMKKDKPTMSVGDAAMQHFTLHYLMRVGMDTRLGYMCAVPVKFRQKVYVAISLNLLSTSFARFFKAHKTGKTIAGFRAAFKSETEAKVNVVPLAMKLMAFKEKACTTAENSKWVVLRAEKFLTMCQAAMEEGEEEWDGLINVVDTQDDEDRGYTFSKQTNCVYKEDNDTPESKMSWGVKASESVLKSEHMAAYRSILKGGEESEGHFTAHQVFEEVRASGVKRKGGGFQVPVGKRGKVPRLHVSGPTKGKRSPDSSGSDSSDSDSGNDSDSDSDTQCDDEEALNVRRNYMTDIVDVGPNSSV